MADQQCGSWIGSSRKQTQNGKAKTIWMSVCEDTLKYTETAMTIQQSANSEEILKENCYTTTKEETGRSQSISGVHHRIIH